MHPRRQLGRNDAGALLFGSPHVLQALREVTCQVTFGGRSRDAFEHDVTRPLAAESDTACDRRLYVRRLVAQTPPPSHISWKGAPEPRPFRHCAEKLCV